MLNDLTKLVKVIAVEGMKTVAVSAGVTIVSVAIAEGAKGVVSITLDRLLK